MTSSHILFIPGVLMVGMFIGFILGARAARNQFDLAQRREQERDAALDAIAQRALAKDPAQRIQSAAELAALLRGL